MSDAHLGYGRASAYIGRRSNTWTSGTFNAIQLLMGRRLPPSVNLFMTRLPHELDARDSVEDARAVMARAGVRHLPIMDGAKLFGVISSRDLAGEGVNDEHQLAQLCVRDVLVVGPTDTVVRAAEEMLRLRVGSAVVMDQGTVVGIFTTADVMSALIAAYKAPA